MVKIYLSISLSGCLEFAAAAVVRHDGLSPRHLQGHQVLHDGVKCLSFI